MRNHCYFWTSARRRIPLRVPHCGVRIPHFAFRTSHSASRIADSACEFRIGSLSKGFLQVKFILTIFVRHAECGPKMAMPNPQCGMRNRQCGLLNVECGIRNAKCGICKRRCGIPHSPFQRCMHKPYRMRLCTREIKSVSVYTHFSFILFIHSSGRKGVVCCTPRRTGKCW